MARRTLAIYGAGGHAKVVADLARACNIDVVGFVDDTNALRKGQKFCGSTVYNSAQQIRRKYSSRDLAAIVAVGDCVARVRIAAQLQAQDFGLLTLVHPTAAVAGSVRMGVGTVVFAGSVANADAIIGENVIVNSSVIVEHDCIVEDGAHLCPGVRLGGHVTIGAQTWIGIGAIVKDHVKIGSNCTVGAGSLVLKNVTNNRTVYGSPAFHPK